MADVLHDDQRLAGLCTSHPLSSLRALLKNVQAGMMVCALLPRDDAHLWGRWGGFFITVRLAV